MDLVNSFNIFQLLCSTSELIFNLLQAVSINLVEIEIYYSIDNDFQDEITWLLSYRQTSSESAALLLSNWGTESAELCRVLW